jgi:hypothetical protein
MTMSVPCYLYSYLYGILGAAFVYARRMNWIAQFIFQNYIHVFNTMIRIYFRTILTPREIFYIMHRIAGK